MNKVLVVARNEREFKSEILSLVKQVTKVIPGRVYADSKEFIYMDCPDRMRGFHGVDIKFVGSWFTRPDASRFEELAMIARIK